MQVGEFEQGGDAGGGEGGEIGAQLPHKKSSSKLAQNAETYSRHSAGGKGEGTQVSPC